MNIFLLALVVMAVYMTIRDYKLMKRHRSFKNYSPLIEPAYYETTENFLKLADEYIANETIEDLKNKARALKIFAISRENKDGYKEVFETFDLNNVFLNNKGQIDKTKEMLNSDAFFWMLLSSIEADIHGNKEFLNAILEKMSSYNDTLSSELYFQMVKAYIEVAMGNKESLNLFKRVLGGDYYEYRYGKDLISIFKKLAAAILVFKGEEIDETDTNNLKTFTAGQAGQFILKEMGIYNRFAEDEVEEEINE